MHYVCAVHCKYSYWQKYLFTQNHSNLIRNLNLKSIFIVIVTDIFASVSNALMLCKSSRHQLRVSGQPILFDSAAKCIYWTEASKRKW